MIVEGETGYSENDGSINGCRQDEGALNMRRYIFQRCIPYKYSPYVRATVLKPIEQKRYNVYSSGGKLFVYRISKITKPLIFEA